MLTNSVMYEPFSTELVFGLMLGISRSIPEAHASMQRGEWAKSRFNGHTLYGKTLGVIGFGSVGQEVCVMPNLVSVV